jgi:hypothetical protein
LEKYRSTSSRIRGWSGSRGATSHAKSSPTPFEVIMTGDAKSRLPVGVFAVSSLLAGLRTPSTEYSLRARAPLIEGDAYLLLGAGGRTTRCFQAGSVSSSYSQLSAFSRHLTQAGFCPEQRVLEMRQAEHERYVRLRFKPVVVAVAATEPLVGSVAAA